MGWLELAGVALDATTETLGEAIVFIGGDLVERPIVGIFDEAHQEVRFIETGVALSSTGPAVAVRLADLGNEPKPGNTVRARGREFLVNDLRPDGSGGALLILEAK